MEIHHLSVEETQGDAWFRENYKEKSEKERKKEREKEARYSVLRHYIQAWKILRP